MLTGKSKKARWRERIKKAKTHYMKRKRTNKKKGENVGGIPINGGNLVIPTVTSFRACFLSKMKKSIFWQVKRENV